MCSRCSCFPFESATVHRDCVEILAQRCTTSIEAMLPRLWIAVAWRKPWRNAPLLAHLTAPVIMDRDTLATICRLAGLPLLEKLPLELLEMVRDYSPHSLLWRCFPILQLAAHLSATPPEPLVTLPLANLLAWERGGKVKWTSSSQPPVHNSCLRLAIDSFGIHTLERLPEWPAYAGESSTRRVFLIQDHSGITDVVAQLKIRTSLSHKPVAHARLTRRRRSPAPRCRRDGCVSKSRPPRPVRWSSGTRPPRPPPSINRPCSTRPRFGMPSTWKRQKASPSSFAGGWSWASTSTAHRDRARWTRRRGSLTPEGT